MKSKRSELRLYCDLLMQQVHSVKGAASQTPPDIEVSLYQTKTLFSFVLRFLYFLVQKLDESTHLLSATCDTFISTLEECLRLAKAELTYQLPHVYPIEKALNGHDLSHSPAPISPTGRKTSRSSRNGGM